MRRGKRSMENDKKIIYVLTITFIVFAVGLGVIMYITSKTGGVKIEGNIASEQENEEKAESVATEMGKTVKEQTETIVSSENNNTTKEKEIEKNTSNISEKNIEIKEKPDEPDTIVDSEEISKNEVTETKKNVTFERPIDGEIICEYAKDNLIYSETLKEWITHTAIDIKADKTSVVKSSADGVVKTIVNDPRYGLTVIIEHEDGYETVYSNLLTAEFVVEGEEVTQGQTIGTVGNTAVFESNMESHLHYELLKDGEYLDPAIYLK